VSHKIEFGTLRSFGHDLSVLVTLCTFAYSVYGYFAPSTFNSGEERPSPETYGVPEYAGRDSEPTTHFHMFEPMLLLWVILGVCVAFGYARIIRWLAYWLDDPTVFIVTLVVGFASGYQTAFGTSLLIGEPKEGFFVGFILLCNVALMVEVAILRKAGEETKVREDFEDVQPKAGLSAATFVTNQTTAKKSLRRIELTPAFRPSQLLILSTYFAAICFVFAIYIHLSSNVVMPESIRPYDPPAPKPKLLWLFACAVSGLCAVLLGQWFGQRLCNLKQVTRH